MAGVVQLPVVRIPPRQTHLVLSGKLKLSAFQDGNILRAVEDGRQLAFLRPDGVWSRPVKDSKAKPPKAWDLIKAIYPAKEVILEKGRYY